MKVPNSLRAIWESLEPDLVRFRRLVDGRIKARIQPDWHYISRVKELISFAQKAETGRFAEPSAIEDLFACSIVVENLDQIATAENLVCDMFELHHKKPVSYWGDAVSSDSFKFDGLRLYVSWRDPNGVRPSGFDGKLFEIQVKTFLQHAWAIATHDLTYKARDKSWARERVVFQTKAMLECAELSIKEANLISGSVALRKTDRYTLDIGKILAFLSKVWKPQELPENCRLLAETVHQFINALSIPLLALKRAVDAETHVGRGASLGSLSPYGIIVQSIINQESRKFLAFVDNAQTSFKLLICDEIVLPSELSPGAHRNLIFLASR